MGLEVELLLRADLIKEQTQRALQVAYSEMVILEQSLERVKEEIQKRQGALEVLKKIREHGLELMEQKKGTRKFEGMKECPKTS